MLLPSKVTCYSESVFPLAIEVLKKLKTQDKEICALYHECRPFIPEISDLITVLDFLFVMGKIELLQAKGMIHYVA